MQGIARTDRISNIDHPPKSQRSRKQVVNPANPVFQLIPHFPPNNESKWEGETENKLEWAFPYVSILGEARRLLQALRIIQLRINNNNLLEAWEVDTLKAAADIHFGGLRCCFIHEEKSIIPLMKQRINMESLIPDRGPLFVKAKQVAMEFENLVEAASPEVSSLEILMRNYVSILARQVKETAATWFPVFRAYFAPDKARWLLLKAIGARNKNENGAFIYYMGDESAQLLRHKQVPWCIQLLILRPAISHYHKTFLQPLEAVEKNRKEGSFSIQKKLQVKLGSSLDFTKNYLSSRSLGGRIPSR